MSEIGMCETAAMSHAPVQRVVSVNVGLPRQVRWMDHTVETGIFKSPIGGRVAVRTLNLDGDQQADLSVHGGPDKAVYAYPSEHYEYWREQLPNYRFDEPAWGQYGENVTTEGLLEDVVHIGDRFRIGTVELQVTQPRLPCYKLGIRFGRPDMLKRFLKSECTGFYLRVLAEGELGAGDAITLISREPHAVRVVDLVQIYSRPRQNVDALRELFLRALAVNALPSGWRDELQERLNRSA